jgi:hypothetical protein
MAHHTVQQLSRLDTAENHELPRISHQNVAEPTAQDKLPIRRKAEHANIKTFQPVH